VSTVLSFGPRNNTDRPVGKVFFNCLFSFWECTVCIKVRFHHVSTICDLYISQSKGSRSIYTLLLIYGASTATTTLPCITTIFALPLTSPETILAGVHSVTTEQKWMLLSSYVPYFVVPLFMTLDMAARVGALMQAGIEARHDGKRK
jgi:EXPERA (EXPanded EBP superfamily)